MRLTFGTILLATSLFVLGCSKNTIIGKWKHEVKPNSAQGSGGAISHWGDITFKSDSTYFIEGNYNADSSNIEGEQKGKWLIEQNHLYLNPNGLHTNYFIGFEIVQLTSTRLILLSPFGNVDPAKYFFYFRDK